MHKLTVIWTRFSSEMQRPASCVDQERKTRQGLDAKDIDHSHAKVFRVEAESGTKTDGAQFDELMQMIQRGEIAVLAVDDQGRFTKSDLAFSMILDLVYNGGRFISVGEGIDTDEPGWELKVKVLALHHSTSNRELARRVRRGQEGRVLDGNGSAGDYGYGYRADFADPNHTQWTGRGPKPQKIVVVYEPEAAIVRMIFAWFIGGMSICAIARRLNETGVDKGHRSWRPGWHHQMVRRMLGNAKYIGHWAWGLTRTLRNSQGKTRQVPVPEDEVVRVDRPELAIIDLGTWEEVQKRLEELHDKYGMKPGQRSRRARTHWTKLYPSSLLWRLIHCGECDAPLVVQFGGGRRYLGCPNHRKGTCGMVVRVRMDRAEEALLEKLAELLRAEPGWLDAALAAMRRTIGELSTQMPKALEAGEQRLRAVERQISNLVQALAAGGGQSDAIMAHLESLERERDTLRARHEEQHTLLAQPMDMPDDELVHARLADLTALLRGELPQSAHVLGKLVGKVTAHQVRPRGKRRGYAQLRFTVSGLAALEVALGDCLTPTVVETAENAVDGSAARSEEIRIDLGAPSRMDEWAPKIAELRDQGVPWKRIAELAGLSLGNAYTAWKRWIDDQESCSDAA